MTSEEEGNGRMAIGIKEGLATLSERMARPRSRAGEAARVFRATAMSESLDPNDG